MHDSEPAAREFIAQGVAGLNTVVLATAGASGEPEASVAAAVLDDDGAFVIFISGLAAHTRNLQANPRASVLLAEDDRGSRNPLARRRVTFACRAVPVARGSETHDRLLGRLREKFGAIVETMAGLPDFQLVRLVPTRARVVAGFGAAFDVGPEGWHRPNTLTLSAVRPRT